MTSENELKFGGQVWTSHDCLIVGDYGDAGTIGEANLRELKRMIDAENAGHKVERLCASDIRYLQGRTEDRAKGKKPHPHGGNTDDQLARLARVMRGKPWMIVAVGSHGFKQAWVNQIWEAGNEAVNALHDYPLINDESIYAVEEEWIERDLADYGADDIERGVNHEAWDGYRELLDAISEDMRKALQRRAFDYARQCCDEDGKQAVIFEHSSCYFHADELAPYYLEFISEWIETDKALFTQMVAAELLRGQCVLPFITDSLVLPAEMVTMAHDAYRAAIEASQAPEGLEPWAVKRLREVAAAVRDHLQAQQIIDDNPAILVSLAVLTACVFVLASMALGWSGPAVTLAAVSGLGLALGVFTA